MAVAEGKINAPKFVKLQVKEFLSIANNKDSRYKIDENKVRTIGELLKLLIMPKGLKANATVYDAMAGFQWLFIIAIMCTVERDNPDKRRYENAILEICRKNGKTFLIAVLFILLFFIEPKFSKFYSVAPDGSLSREIKTAIEEILRSSPAMLGKMNGKEKFKMLRDYIHCNITENRYIPLNYSTGRLDGKLPSVFLVDETGALPNTYAIEAMRSGQLTILNKLGFIISTKYPTLNNPFEDEVDYAKRVLNGAVDDDKVFALLYEPDDTKGWATNDEVLEQSNPLAIEVTEIMEDLKAKRQVAIEIESKRENFITKHCNIIYSGAGSESFVNIADLQKGAVDHINWNGREVFLGVDLAMTTDNCAVSMVAYDEDEGQVLLQSVAFIPEDRIDEKSKLERIPYRDFINAGNCIPCGNRTVDYGAIERYIMEIESKYGVTVMGIGYDRYNALSTAQKLEDAGYTMVEIKQHSSVLHPATKWVAELVAEGNLLYDKSNKLLEINFENSRCVYDTNMNRYVNKKKSRGKVDMVVAGINAMYLLHQNYMLNSALDWVVQI
ncbi:MAG: terminase TerL endonuclease subunit [Veillonella sp.]|jgi:phage terminase|uniref:terminase large subunit n=1 Tax=Veillonella sp. TaxID=1926307 RepID=UPI002906B4DD|nr:terminase TerL endonuclease subunit [Veillonella sp.]MDU7875226.1 terminase TerL endonuclease subunit [Veillonella sp.]MDU7935917.1 terminase TerL endonuclease subunit [Veillonella sp.]